MYLATALGNPWIGFHGHKFIVIKFCKGQDYIHKRNLMPQVNGENNTIIPGIINYTCNLILAFD